MQQVSNLTSVPAETVISTLVNVGAATQAEVQLAAELVSARIEIGELREKLETFEDHGERTAS